MRNFIDPRWLAMVFLATTLASCQQVGHLRDGDIIFHRSTSRQAVAIAAATHSAYTHVGLVFLDSGKPFVYEAVQRVKRTPLKEWIARGERQHFVIKRLKADLRLNSAALKSEAQHMLGKDYDWLFEWSDSKIYCSELVWKAYQRSHGIEIGRLRSLRDFDLTSPVVLRQMQERYGKRIPWEMSVIAPSDIFDSPLLCDVPNQ